MVIIKILDNQLEPTIKGCIAQDRVSQKRFYFAFYGFAAAVCHKYIWNDEMLQEVVNDGFLKVFKGLHKFQLPVEHAEVSLKAWMRRVMVNTAIDRLRKDRHYNLHEGLTINEHTLETVAAPAAEDTLTHKELLNIISNLSPAYRLVFSLHVLDGYTHEEIGEMLKISKGTSKSNLAKARMHLKRMITEAGQTNDNYAERAV